MSYEHKFKALGRLLDARIVRDVCIIEVPTGLKVSALGQMDRAGKSVWEPLSFEVDGSELSELMSMIKADTTNGAAGGKKSRFW